MGELAGYELCATAAVASGRSTKIVVQSRRKIAGYEVSAFSKGHWTILGRIDAILPETSIVAQGILLQTMHLRPAAA